MLRLRLRREGAKAQPIYRIVAAEREHPRDGRFLEVLGEYNPRTTPTYIKVNEARILLYLKNGAQPSESVERLFKATGTLERLARLKKGEPLEALLAEAETAAAARSVNLKTREASAPKGKSKKAKAKEAAAAAS